VKTKLFLIALWICSLGISYAQNYQSVEEATSEDEIEEICRSVSVAFTSTPREIQKIVDQIVKTAGVANGGFELAQCSNIQNAVAKMVTNKKGDVVRYIIYDGAWLQSLVDETSNDWTGKFVLAHEIGHHLNGHSLNNGSSNHNYELEADYFAGRALANLGATLDETLAVTEEMNVKATFSHPARVDRAAQAKAGWQSITNKELTIVVKDEEVSEIAKKIVSMIHEKLSTPSSLTEEDYQKTIKQLRLVRGPKYYKGYTEDIRYLEAITLLGLKEEDKAMEAYINYLSIEGLDKEERIKQIGELYVESSSSQNAFFANPLVVYNLSKVYFKNKKYDKAITLGNQFLSRSEDPDKKTDIIEIVAKSEFEKIENEIAELTPSEALTQASVHIQNLDYKKAQELLKPLSNKNVSEAQYLLGILHLEGKGYPVDAVKAADLFATAAQSNNADAQLKLGYLYMEGNGVTKSLDNSRFWIGKAAEANHPDAASALNTLKSLEAAIERKKEEEKIAEIEEIKETEAETMAKTLAKADTYFNNGLLSDAFENYLIAAKKGNAGAQERVGWMYFKGKGVKKDKDLGIEWWKKAAMQGNGTAISFLTRLGKW
jgi:TPR repeat protein